ncbi:MAG TPA: hypothetical protein V6C71_13405 [Coleofasciculaceae cyanobacterium]|jgi:hypothetical protein
MTLRELLLLAISGIVNLTVSRKIGTNFSTDGLGGEFRQQHLAQLNLASMAKAK